MIRIDIERKTTVWLNEIKAKNGLQKWKFSRIFAAEFVGQQKRREYGNNHT